MQAPLCQKANDKALGHRVNTLWVHRIKTGRAAQRVFNLMIVAGSIFTLN